jgi:hypothetical protein
MLGSIFPGTIVRHMSGMGTSVHEENHIGFFMLRLRYVMFPAMKAVFTTAADACYHEAKPTIIGQSQVRGTCL